ncbi:MAG: hypothetical protein H9855_09390 [Candidatus Acinetobacter avistercoris]|nr:hypothetical protein [Candidatus Acinetobacter avistercoris]
MKKIFVPLFVSLLLAGCATTQMSPETRNQYNQIQTALKSAPVAVLINPCLLTNELGKDLILAEPSRLSSDKFLETFNQQLNQQGITIGKSAAPFICGLMPEEQMKKYDFQADSITKRAPISTYPLLNQTGSTLTTEQQNAVLALNQFFVKYNSVELANLRNKSAPAALPELDQATLDILKNWSASEYLFIINIDGLDASMGSKFAMGALSAGVTLATLGIGGGLVTAYMPQEGQQYTVRLFDLNKKQFIWTKSALLKGKVFSTKNHSLEAKNTLDPLFELKIK